MESKLEIHATEVAPEIILDKTTGNLCFSGKSLPEDAFTFYQPVLEWLTEYISSPNNTTTVEFKLEYFNTASSKQIFKILNLLKELSKTKQVKIFWYYDKGDKDMQISGNRFAKLCELEIELKEN